MELESLLNPCFEQSQAKVVGENTLEIAQLSRKGMSVEAPKCMCSLGLRSPICKT